MRCFTVSYVLDSTWKYNRTVIHRFSLPTNVIFLLPQTFTTESRLNPDLLNNLTNGIPVAISRDVPNSNSTRLHPHRPSKTSTISPSTAPSSAGGTGGKSVRRRRTRGGGAVDGGDHPDRTENTQSKRRVGRRRRNIRGGVNSSKKMESEHDVAPEPDVKLEAVSAQTSSSVDAPTNPTPSTEHTKPTKPQSRKKHEMEVETARQWFMDLPSGEERACAAAITDASFIAMYVGLWRQHALEGDCVDGGVESENNFPFQKSAMTSYSRSELSRLYEQQQRHCAGEAEVPPSPGRKGKGSPKDRRKARSSSVASRNDVDEVVSVKDGLKGIEESIDEKVASTTPMEHKSSEEKTESDKATKDSPAMESHFKETTTADKIMPAIVQEFASEIETLEKDEDDATPDKLTDSKHHNDTNTEPLFAEPNETPKPTSFTKDELRVLNSFAELHRYLRLSKSSFGKTTSSKTKECKTFDVLLLDPSFLENGERFLKIAEDIIHLHRRRRGAESFLSTPPAKRSRDAILRSHVKMSYFPAWVNAGRRHGVDVISFHYLVLARMEMAIWGAYYRHLQSARQAHASTYDFLCVGKMDGGTQAMLNTLSLENSVKNNEEAASNKDKKPASDSQPDTPKTTSIHLDVLLTLHKAQTLKTIQSESSDRSLKHLNPLFQYFKTCGIYLRKPKHHREDPLYEYCKEEVSLEHALLLPWNWVEKLVRKQEDALGDLHPCVVKVWRNLVALYPGRMEDDPKAEGPDLEDLFGNTGVDGFLGEGKVGSKNKKKKKKKKKRKGANNGSTTSDKQRNQTSNQVKPTENTPQPSPEPHQDTTPPPSPSQKIPPMDDRSHSTTGSIKPPFLRSESTDIKLHTVESTGATCIIVERQEYSASADESSVAHGESWERVETKGRNNRKNNGKFMEEEGKNKQKSKSTNPRRRVASRKIVRDILWGILDDVEVAVIKRKKQAEEERKRREEKKLLARSASTVSEPDRRTSLRDIVMGTAVSTANKLEKSSDKQQQTTKKITQEVQTKPVQLLTSTNGKPTQPIKPMSTPPTPTLTKTMDTKPKPPIRSETADRSTDPTLPETLSGISNPCSSPVEISEIEHSSSSEELPDNDAHSPPLPTLLSGPGNANSATSSVASSLEAPHAASSLNKEKDVGYHLLNVCERLSTDMTKFMARRSLALSARRRERGALLASLQDTVTKIWPGRCHVEMYGSCATQLDLPSSDLDVVIVGLGLPKQKRKKMEEEYDHVQASSHHAINAGRVQRLAAELECQPWTAQVKAIPTASVPVVKILADPARIPGINSGSGHDIHPMNYSEWIPSASSGEWMVPDMSRRIAIAPAQSGGNISSHFVSNQQGSQPAVIAPYPTPWRGADVMNGLIKLDITFEGPEHGGIGSTAYTARVMQEACTETGLPPEATPIVQLTMVLKELLAQRRLNEPFSGGLSSYALLLMVVAIMRERVAIKAEMELAEHQCRGVGTVSHDVNEDNGENAAEISVASSGSTSTPQAKSGSANTAVEKPKPTNSDHASFAAAVNASSVATSSWASVAKQNKPKPYTSRKEKEKEKIPQEKTSTAPQKDSSTPANNGTTYSSIKTLSSETTPTAASTLCSSANAVQNSPVIAPSIPQGSNDVLEVLCSGEPTAGKLLMHFLLYYGKHYDALATSIDVTAPESNRGPFVPRQVGGTFDPYTGMLTVDPIVVFDPLEGAEGNNVAKSCFAWQSVKWVFNQCFNTLTHTVERRGKLSEDDGGDSSALLELLLSY